MKKCWIRVIATSLLLISGLSLAVPVSPVTVTFVGGSVDFATFSSGEADYVVSLNPKVSPANIPLTFSIVSSGASSALTATQITTGASPCAGVSTLCVSPFSLSAGQSCCLAYTLTSATQGNFLLQPTITTTPPTYTAQACPALNVPVSDAEHQATLTSSLSTLALSVNDPGTNAALTGTAREITITNTSSETAFGVTVTPSNLAPANPVITPTCGDIPPSGTCVVTVTPSGATASATPYNLSPTPITLTIAGVNTNTVSPTVNILTYGSVYEGGYVFAIDDTTPVSTSVGGKVVALTDQMGSSPGIIWSSNGTSGTSADVATDSIYGISNTSTTLIPDPAGGQVPGQTACNGLSDGACDTNNLYVYYQGFSAGAPVNLNYYAAGLCKQTISGYSDWYLPSMCELGPTMMAFGACPSSQNIIDDLPALLGASAPCATPTGCIAGDYWSSTEYTPLPVTTALYWNILSGGSTAIGTGKGVQNSARCTRALTP